MDDTMNIPFKRKRLNVTTIDPTEDAKKQEDIQKLQKAIEREKNNKYQLLEDIASELLFYDESFVSIHIRPLTIKDVIKIDHANNTENLRNFVEAISSTILEDFSIYDFTVGDFYHLLYWLRLNSYFEAPFTYKLVCMDPDHIQKIRDDELEIDTLYTEEVFTSEKLEIVRVKDSEKLKQFTIELQEKYKIDLRPQLVSDLIEYKELEDSIREEILNKNFPNGIITKLDESKLNQLLSSNTTLKVAQSASYLSAYHGQTLVDKIQFLIENEELPPIIMSLIDKYVAMSYHGVKETVTGKCKECGASIETEVSIDALNFFS